MEYSVFSIHNFAPKNVFGWYFCWGICQIRCKNTSRFFIIVSENLCARGTSDLWGETSVGICGGTSGHRYFIVQSQDIPIMRYNTEYSIWSDLSFKWSTVSCHWAIDPAQFSPLKRILLKHKNHRLLETNQTFTCTDRSHSNVVHAFAPSIVIISACYSHELLSSQAIFQGHFYWSPYQVNFIKLKHQKLFIVVACSISRIPLE